MLLICAASALTPSGALAGTLDQQQADGSGPDFDVYSLQSLGQTFTAGLSGKVDQVDLHLGKFLTPSGPLTVEIRDVSGGVPGSMVLASQSVAASSIPDHSVPAFVPVNFAAPASVSAGAQYAVVAHSSTAFANTYSWNSSTPANPYARGVGSFASSSPPTSPWMSLSQDLAFKTYVAPVATTPATPTGQRAAALKKCKKKRTARARKKCRRKAKLLPV